MPNSRREFLRKSALVAVSGALLSNTMDVFAEETTVSENSFTLPPLPYAYDALEPYIDKQTMEIHHTKHHQAYVTNLNKALTDNQLKVNSLEELMGTVSKHPAAVRNNGGGHWNHTFFWESMKPGGGGTPEGRVAEAINQSFGSFEELKKQLNEAGLKRFGSGWAWLVKSKEGKLIIGSTPNQDNPLMDVSDLKGQPVLGIDVWEHAYYLKYQNKRGEYLSAWWNLVNWDKVAGLL